MATAGEGQRRAKRDSFSKEERDSLAAIALALPPGWVAVIDTSGQIAMLPAQYQHTKTVVACADGRVRRIKLAAWWWARAVA